MDEPLSNLDAKLRTQTRLELVELHRRLGTTIVYVTHDQVEAMTMADRIAVISDGRLQQVGAPQAVYERPANLFVASFIGSPPMNTIAGTLSLGSGHRRGAHRRRLARRSATRARPPSGAAVVVGIRPEHLAIAPRGRHDAAGHGRERRAARPRAPRGLPRRRRAHDASASPTTPRRRPIGQQVGLASDPRRRAPVRRRDHGATQLSAPARSHRRTPACSPRRRPAPARDGSKGKLKDAALGLRVPAAVADRLRGLRVLPAVPPGLLRHPPPVPVPQPSGDVGRHRAADPAR